jgi:hypothetical protein
MSIACWNETALTLIHHGILESIAILLDLAVPDWLDSLDRSVPFPHDSSSRPEHALGQLRSSGIFGIGITLRIGNGFIAPVHDLPKGSDNQLFGIDSHGCCRVCPKSAAGER